MGSANDGRKKIQRLNEQKMRPRKLMGGRMNVFVTVCHCSKPNLSSNSFRERCEADIVSFEIGIKLKFDIFLDFFYLSIDLE